MTRLIVCFLVCALCALQVDAFCSGCHTRGGRDNCIADFDCKWATNSVPNYCTKKKAMCNSLQSLDSSEQEDVVAQPLASPVLLAVAGVCGVLVGVFATVVGYKLKNRSHAPADEALLKDQEELSVVA
eukprot:NODE_3413_length_557_cov_736.358268_g2880_i0.p1 GENE.NODE_3413_length_557_cov_736.358268_g2880_i0~~NODE_3413_length_557_cov_736.358268_g2880_i0.p1  ORF type:complete len:144 (-),score=49.76 NODE_3413_length_557_cov_736.358268_g2880_i0:125-508(-)